MDIDINKSDFNKTIAPWIGKTSKMMNMYFSDVFQRNNIQITKQQWILLKILFENNEGIIQNNLAFITDRNKASLTRLINGMEKNNLVARIQSKDDSALFDGKGGCFIESGRDTASLIEVDMFTGPAPSTNLTESTHEHLDEKLQFEKDRFSNWL